MKALQFKRDDGPEVDLHKLAETIQRDEENYQKLVIQENLLNELKTQKRHIDKKIATFGLTETLVEGNRYFTMASLLKRELEYLRKEREKPENRLIKAYFRLRFSAETIDLNTYTQYQWRLELMYATKMINDLEVKVAALPKLKAAIKANYSLFKTQSIHYLNQIVAERVQHQHATVQDISQKLKKEG